MRYIRFLKPPRITPDKSRPFNHSITCLITITSDLGDSFLPHAVTLSAELHLCEAPDEIIVWRTAHWTPGMRSLEITFPLRSSFDKNTWPVFVQISAENNSSRYRDIFKTELYEKEGRGVVSAWSAVVDPTVGVREAERVVERKFGDGEGGRLAVWEETGESIARHLWDAGITMACHIKDLIRKADPALIETRDKLRVLELGTGCGIVGISIAQAIQNSEVILTDLPEAEEIVDRNIKHAKPAEGSTLLFKELNWDNELPQDLSLNDSPLDMIVAADCTYNSDSSPALVNTMRRLSEMSPNAVIVIAMKKRHSSEEIFFDLMSDAGFKTRNTTEIPLPGDEEPGEETVFVYQFGWTGRKKMMSG